MKKFLAGDYLMITECGVIGMTAVAHLAGVVLGWPFSNCVLLLGGLLCAVLGGGTFIFCLTGRRRRREAGPGQKRAGILTRTVPEGRLGRVLYAVLTALVLTQLLFLCMADAFYRGGDLTVETVGSFLDTDALYQVNPMTGRPYTQGMPLRLKILCLPTLYGGLCKLTGLSPESVVWRIVPVIVLISSYIAFGLLAAALFPDTEGSDFRERRVCFLTVVSLLMWAGAYQYGMDGFGLLCSGWRGVTIRNLVLLPWLFSLCLRRRWLLAVLCIPAEACIVWTLYGCGVCLPVLLGMAVITLCCRMGRSGADGG